MKRFYGRPTPFCPLSEQTAAADKGGVSARARYFDERRGNGTLPERTKCIQSLRSGDELAVYGLARLAVNRKDLTDVLKMVTAKQATVFDLETGETSTAGAVRSVANAYKDWAGEKRLKSPEEAKERGAKGGRPVVVPDMSVREAKQFWYDLTMTAAEALEHMTGWERKKAYIAFGPRGLRGKAK